MFPVWFFAVLVSMICYLLFITRPSNESLAAMSRTRIRKLQFWVRSNVKQ